MGLFILFILPVLVNSICLRQLAGASNDLGCTAKDVKLSIFTKLSGVRVCAPGSKVLAELRATLTCGANTRYDIGITVAQDGGNAQTGTCFNAMLEPVSKTNMDLKLLSGVGPYYNAELSTDPNDLCGDIEANKVNYRTMQPIEITCSDANGDGLVDLSACTSWDNQASAGNSIKPSCTSILQTGPSTQSKCSCEVVSVPTILHSVGGNLSFSVCPNGYSLIAGVISDRIVTTPVSSLRSLVSPSRFSQCLQAHWSCYSGCSAAKMVCDDQLVSCVEAACVNGTSDVYQCQDTITPLVVPYTSESNWKNAMATCLCLGPGGTVLPSTYPPSGLESWPLYDPINTVSLNPSQKYNSIDLDDFASAKLLDVTGQRWRTVLKDRPDIVAVSSAEQVREAQFLDLGSAFPSAGVIVAKGRVVNEHTVSTCARYLGGQLLTANKVRVGQYTFFVSMVQQESPKSPVFAVTLALALYENRGVVFPVWSPTTAEVDPKGLLGIISFQLWSTLPRKDLLHTMLIRLFELFESPSDWAIALDTGALKSDPNGAALEQPAVWFSSITHVFPGRIALDVSFQSDEHRRRQASSTQVRVRCWKEPNSAGWSEFNTTVTPEAGNDSALLNLKHPLGSVSSVQLPTLQKLSPLDLSECIDVSIWITAGSWVDQVFLSQGFFFGMGSSKWTGGAKNVPVYSRHASSIVLPGSVEVKRDAASSAELGVQGLVRAFTAHGCVDLTAYRFIHFMTNAQCASSMVFHLEVKLGSGDVSSAVVEASEDSCFSLVSVDLTKMMEPEMRKSVCSISLSPRNGGDACFAFANLILSNDEATRANFSGTNLCSSVSKVAYATDSGLTSNQWIGIAIGILALVAIAMLIVVLVVRKRRVAGTRRKTSLLANQQSVDMASLEEQQHDAVIDENALM